MKKACIIGAGLSGLCAARHCLKNKLTPTIFEQTNKVGGTWILTNEIDKDEYGIDIHSSMYHELRTNLPKEIMGFPDFPFKNDKIQSYISANEVLQFIEEYSENFKLNEKIKFRHYVTKIIPYNKKWKVYVKELLKNELNIYIFDFIIICNGHYFEPNLPSINGIETFKGTIIHSHQFRNYKEFQNQSVLIIGAGPSGIDIAYLLHENNINITLSHHSKEDLYLPNEIIQKPDIKEINHKTIIFMDDSKMIYNTIIFCTGYHYTYPFLSEKCLIKVDNNYVKPLYKQIININYPTMAFIGLQFKSLIAQLVDLQIRFIMEYYSGRKEFPNQDEMFNDEEINMNKRWSKGWSKSNAHKLGPDFRDEYYNDLAITANIEFIKPVMIKLLIESNKQMKYNFGKFRQINYKIIDDENFLEL